MVDEASIPRQAIAAVRADIQTTTAAASLSRTGSEIGLGKRTSRIVLDPENPQFNLEIREPKSQSLIMRGYNLGSSILKFKRGSTIENKDDQYVPLRIVDDKGRERTVEVKVSEFARLHLKPEEVIEAAKQGQSQRLQKDMPAKELAETEKKQLKKEGEAGVKKQSLEELIGSYTERKGDEPKSKLDQLSQAVAHYKDVKLSSDMSGKKTMKAVKSAFETIKKGDSDLIISSKKEAARMKEKSEKLTKEAETLRASGKPEDLEKAQKLEKEAKSLAVAPKHRYVVWVDEKDKSLHMVQITSVLNDAGANGVIYNAIEHRTNEEMIYKESKRLEASQEDLKNENIILTEIGPNDLIQLAPYKIFVGDKVAYLGRLYENGSMNSAKAKQIFEAKTPEEKLGEVRRVLEGLIFFKKRGILHGDIKTGNFLVRADGKLVFGDWGGARFKTQKGDNSPLPGFEAGKNMIAHTSNYVSFKDVGEISDLCDTFKEKAELVKQKEKELKTAEADFKRSRKSRKTKESVIQAKRSARDTARESLKLAIKQREETRELYHEARHKMDVFAAGAALHEILTGEKHLSPEQYHRSMGYPHFNPRENYKFNDEKLVAAGWKDSGLIELVEKMVEPDPEKRIGPDELMAEFDKIDPHFFQNWVF